MVTLVPETQLELALCRKAGRRFIEFSDAQCVKYNVKAEGLLAMILADEKRKFSELRKFELQGSRN